MFSVDLYCELGTKVVSCENGEVVAIEWFTGKFALTNEGIPSDWYASILLYMIILLM